MTLFARTFRNTFDHVQLLPWLPAFSAMLGATQLLLRWPRAKAIEAFDALPSFSPRGDIHLPPTKLQFPSSPSRELASVLLNLATVPSMRLCLMVSPMNAAIRNG